MSLKIYGTPTGQQITVAYKTGNPSESRYVNNNGNIIYEIYSPTENLSDRASFESLIASNPSADLTSKWVDITAESANKLSNITTVDEFGNTKTYDTVTNYEDLDTKLNIIKDNKDGLPFIKGAENIISSGNIFKQSANGYSDKEIYSGVKEQVNPWSGFFDEEENKRVPLEQTMNGTDLTVFFMAEFPEIEDIINGVPLDACRKEQALYPMDNVLSIQYSTIREKFPVRVIGEANPRAYTKGPRTIAGHIVFSVFTEDVLSRLRGRIRNKFHQIKNKFKNFAVTTQASADKNSASAQEFAKKMAYYQAAFEFDRVQLLDSLAPFHLLVMGVNDQGTWSRFIIKNVSIIDENQTQGMYTLNIFNKCSFVAKDIVPMATFNKPNWSSIDSINSITESYNGNFSYNTKYNTITGSDVLRDISEDLAKEIDDAY